jgi:hypothetical protein
MSVMGRLLAANAPLRGRASLELIVDSFGYRTAARFWQIDDPKLAVLVHSIVGGTPAYRQEFVGGDAPESLTDFGDWVPRTAQTWLTCSSGAGFDQELHAAAGHERVRLVDLSQLYAG